MSTAKRGRIQNQKIPTTSSQSILGFVTRQEPTAQIFVSKILADLISKVIDESDKSVKVENRQTDKSTVERQKNYINDR